MANKVTTNPNDLLNPRFDNGSEMDDSMKELMKVKAEILSEAESNKEKDSTTEETPAPKKKTTPKKKSEKTLTSREVIEQAEGVKKNTDGRPIISDRNEIVKDMKAQFNDLVSRMTIDLNNIVLSDSLNTMEKQQNTDIVFHSKPTFEIPLAQSCFTAYMEALVLDDIDGIVSSTGSTYSITRKTYETILKKMAATTIGKMDFHTFTSCTSFFDLPSLYYALHLQTFPGSTNFSFECAHCKHKFSKDIPNDLLVSSRDEKVFERFDEIRRLADSPKYVMENSLISKSTRVCLNESKTIFEIRIPSLKDHLDLLKEASEYKNSSIEDDAITVLFFKNVFMLNVPETLEKGSPIYYQIKGVTPVINIVKQLSLADSKQLSKAIEDWTEQYKIEYKIPSFKCPNPDCGKELGDMPVDMEQTLFRHMLSQ